MASPPLLGSLGRPFTDPFACSQGLFQRRRVWITTVRVFFQTTENDALKVGWHCLYELSAGNERFIGMSVKHFSICIGDCFAESLNIRTQELEVVGLWMLQHNDRCTVQGGSDGEKAVSRAEFKDTVARGKVQFLPDCVSVMAEAF